MRKLQKVDYICATSIQTLKENTVFSNMTAATITEAAAFIIGRWILHLYRFAIVVRL